MIQNKINCRSFDAFYATICIGLDLDEIFIWFLISLWKFAKFYEYFWRTIQTFQSKGITTWFRGKWVLFVGSLLPVAVSYKNIYIFIIIATHGITKCALNERSTASTWIIRQNSIHKRHKSKCRNAKGLEGILIHKYSVYSRLTVYAHSYNSANAKIYAYGWRDLCCVRLLLPHQAKPLNFPQTRFTMCIFLSVCVSLSVCANMHDVC